MKFSKDISMLQGTPTGGFDGVFYRFFCVSGFVECLLKSFSCPFLAQPLSCSTPGAVRNTWPSSSPAGTPWGLPWYNLGSVVPVPSAGAQGLINIYQPSEMTFAIRFQISLSELCACQRLV